MDLLSSFDFQISDKNCASVPQNCRGVQLFLSAYLFKHLYTLNSFNSLVAIFVGLQNSSVVKVHPSFPDLPKVQQEIMKELEIIVGDDNYEYYHQLYSSLAAPVIPFL